MNEISEESQARAMGTEEGPGAGLTVDDGIEEELLVEEVSIDGMCGVY